MNNIYKETIEKVADGARFSVSFPNRSLKVSGKWTIKDGKHEGELGVPVVDDVVAEIERLYGRYYHSVPSERSDHNTKQYFRALDGYDLSDDDMWYGKRREEARAELEVYFLCALINGTLKWEMLEALNPKASWFWQSPTHPTLIIFKSWFNNLSD